MSRTTGDQPDTSTLGAVLDVIGQLVLVPLGLADLDDGPADTEPTEWGGCRCVLVDEPRDRVR